jgi:hypothetical protein
MFISPTPLHKQVHEGINHCTCHHYRASGWISQHLQTSCRLLSSASTENFSLHPHSDYLSSNTRSASRKIFFSVSNTSSECLFIYTCQINFEFHIKCIVSESRTLNHILRIRMPFLISKNITSTFVRMKWFSTPFQLYLSFIQMFSTLFTNISDTNVPASLGTTQNTADSSRFVTACCCYMKGYRR